MSGLKFPDTHPMLHSTCHWVFPLLNPSVSQISWPGTGSPKHYQCVLINRKETISRKSSMSFSLQVLNHPLSPVVSKSFTTPWTGAHRAPLSRLLLPLISQARILEWVALPFSRGSSQPRDRTHVSCIGRQVLYHWATKAALLMFLSYQYIHVGFIRILKKFLSRTIQILNKVIRDRVETGSHFFWLCRG